MTPQPDRRPAVGRVRELMGASHPLPTVAVTVLTAGLCAVAGTGIGTAILVVVAVLAGQLSIGWSNDYLDAERDVAVHRSDKPVARGAIGRRPVGIAALLGLLAAVALAGALVAVAGWAGPVSLVLLACGWLYNIGLKATAASFAPYAVGFGSLPAVATLAAGSGWPPWWAVTAGATLGVAAHFGNVLPDLRDDLATGVRGLPQRLGLRATAAGMPVLLALGSLAIVLGARFPGPVDVGVGAGLVVLAAAGVLLAVRRPPDRSFFLLALVVALVDLTVFVAAGGSLR